MGNIHYFFSFAWGAYILVSFIGWGSFLKELFLPKKEIDWGQKAAWGVAFSIFVGGVLNVCWAISKVTVISYAGAGILCFIAFEFLRVRDFLINAPQKILGLWRQDKIAVLVVFAVTSFLIFFYFKCDNSWNWNHGDDALAYGIFPQKMLEQGSLGYEPFSERRMYALGGQSFLHALVLCFLPSRSLHIIDPGIANIIVIGLLWGLAKEFQVSRRIFFFICLLFLCLPCPIANVSSLVMGMALCLALFRAFGNHRGVFITALLMSALCASKSNFIVFCGVYFIISYFLRFLFESSKKSIALEFLAVAGLFLLFLMPWMISSYQSSGTFLYPILGRGYHYSAYGILQLSPPVTVELIKQSIFNFLYTPSAILMIVITLYGFRNSSRSRALWASAIYLGAFFSLIIIKIFLPLGPRFGWPIFWASTTVLIFYALKREEKPTSVLLQRVFFVFLIFSIPYFINYHRLRFFDKTQKNIMLSFLYNLRSEFKDLKGEPDVKTVQSYLNAQRSVPAGEIIIARVEGASLLDFKRNKILIVDYLILGPKPGMPIFKGPEAVAEYLLSKGMRYIMYSYCDEGAFSKKRYGWQLKTKDLLIRTEAMLLFTFQDDLIELSKTKKKIYDDGRIFVLDLA